MKICILTARFPYPQYGGGVLRINEIAKYLKSQGHKLVLVSLTDNAHPDLDAAKNVYDKVYTTQRFPLNSYLNSALHIFKGKPMQCGYYYSKAYKKLLKEVVEKEKPDMYISHILRMVPYLEALGVEENSIVEMTDALSKSYGLSLQAKGVGLKKFVFFVEHYLIKRYEEKVIRKFPKVILVSQSDVEYLKQNVCATTDNVFFHTNGVDHLNEIPDTYDSNKICFIGSMGYLPNQDAALYLAHDIFPLIKKEVPSAKLYLVGSLPPANIQALASDDIIVTGYVDNLESFISDSCLSIAPIRVAAGIQNKVLAAMGTGVPVVLTSLISHAIPELVDGKNCIIRDNPKEIASKCVELMKNKELRTSIGKEGYNMVCNHYSWQEKLSGYEKLKA